MVRKLVLAVAAASALMSSSVAQALGVGDINLRSALNQPLDAEIELLQTRDLSSQEILPALASPDEFGRAGIERDFFLTDLVFTPIVRSDGRSVIRVTSSRPVREPFLNFLMEVRWPSGRVLREFTLLLDPPLYDPAPVMAPRPSVAPARPAAVAPAVQRPAPAAPSAAAPVSRPSQAATALSGEYRTNRSDTLWEIALRSRPQGASVHQTMLAIQDLNPGAFIDNNINRMRAEQTLRLPDEGQVRSRSQAEAVDQVAAQNAAWRSGRQQAEPAQRQLDARQQETAAPAPSTAPSGDSLRLVAGSEEQGDGVSDSRSNDDTSQLRDQLDRTKEQLDSVERDKAEADARLTEMQAQMDTLQRLLELKDAQLAAMQQMAGSELPEAAPETDSAEDIAAALAAADEQEMALVDETGAPTGELAAPTDSLADTAAEGDQPADSELGSSEVVEPAAVEPVAPVAETPPAPVVEEPVDSSPQALLQRMMQNQTFMLAGGAVILLLVLLLLMALARRNARREAEMADNFIARAAQGRETAEADDSDEFNVALAGFEGDADSELDIARDPLTEADALIAYGKLAEASDVLTRGIEQEPERVDLRLKLMEVDALLDNAEGYVAQEAELRSMNNAGSYQIQALNARFPAMAAALAASAVPNDVSDLDDLDDAFLSDTSSAGSAAETEEQAITDFDFSGFESDAEAAPQSELAEEEGLDLDFDLDESLAEDLADPGVPPTEKKLEETEFDLEFGLEEPVAPVQEDTTEFTLDEDFDLSLTDDLPADDSLIDEMDKLDAGIPEPAEETSFELSEEDLKDFEAELEGSTEASADLDLAGFDAPAAEEELEFETVSTEPVVPQGDEAGDDDEFDFLSGTDECATKLDLARAYIDMGDQEGARDILAEVLDEGSEQQKQEAQEMMGQLD